MKSSINTYVLQAVVVSLGMLLIASCDRDDDRAKLAEERIVQEQRLRTAAEAQASVERAKADRNYAIAVGAIAGGCVALLVGGVIGIALGTRARRDAERQRARLRAEPGSAGSEA